jgi:hypothetical protein
MVGSMLASPVLAADTGPTASRYRLRAVQIEPVPPPSRYTVEGRWAPLASPGELRESPKFTLIGHFAKAGGVCTNDGTIFRNGFEDSP